jgi:PTS system galactitol-specific IIA component
MPLGLLCIAALRAESAEQVVRALSQRLISTGHVHPSFEQAVLARERRSPTGLPFSDVGVAIPHAEPNHVVSPAIAIATLAAPARFRQMGSPAIQLDVSIVVMPALTAKEQAQAKLSQLIEWLQDDAVRHALMRAQSTEDLAKVLARLGDA